MKVTSQTIVKKLLGLTKVQDMLETIKECPWNKTVAQTLLNCIEYIYQESEDLDELKILEIESVVDFLHDELNSGHWSNVPLGIKKCFTCACFVKCLIYLKRTPIPQEELLKKCLKFIDMGLLLGAPFSDNELLTESGKYLSTLIGETCVIQNPSIKRKLDDSVDFNTQHKLIKGRSIEAVFCPSLENFNKNFFKLQIPVKIQGILTLHHNIAYIYNLSIFLQVECYI